MERKAIVLAVAFILFTTSFPSVTTFSTKNNTSRYLKEIYNDDSHIIDNPRVPYVKQTTDIYCQEASITMLINYYGFNATIEEILHNLGCGYSLFHYRFVPVPRTPIGGLAIYPSTSFDTDFLASLYNLSFHDYSIRNQSEEILWGRYWTKVKELIRNDIPVLTAVDACSLTYWKKFFKRHNISENETHNCQHAIVIVGYNDSNGTVCYNDPAVAIFDTEENGTYIFEKKEVFREAVINAHNGSCLIWAFKKIPGSPPSHEERFEKAHKRNVKRLKGEFEAYFGFNLSNLPFFYRLYVFLCFRFGIDAVKTLKKDFQRGIFHRVITVTQYSKYAFLNFSYEMIYLEKHNVSQYLLQNVNISPACKHDGLLLQNESELWKNLTLLIEELNKISRNNNLIKTLILAQPLLDEINQLIDEIIEIEDAIINQNF